MVQKALHCRKETRFNLTQKYLSYVTYLTTLGAHLAMNFSMSAGPKGAAPPLTVSTDERWVAAFTIGFVDRKLRKIQPCLMMMQSTAVRVTQRLKGQSLTVAAFEIPVRQFVCNRVKANQVTVVYNDTFDASQGVTVTAAFYRYRFH